jgi:hypothetical protein
VHAGLGDADDAFQYLELAVKELNWEIAWLHVDPFWESLRKDARFERLQVAAGLPR